MSVSCSDKLARSNVLGAQGALCSRFIDDAIRFDALVIGCDESERDVRVAAARRALNDRVRPLLSALGDNYVLPVLAATKHVFEHAQSATRTAAVSTAIHWSRASTQAEPTYEVVIGGTGQLLGTTKRNRGKARSRSVLCKRNLAAKFLDLLGGDGSDDVSQFF